MLAVAVLSSSLTMFVVCVALLFTFTGASSTSASDATKLADIMGAYEKMGECPYLYETISARFLKQLYETEYKVLLGATDKTDLIKNFFIQAELRRLEDYADKLGKARVSVMPTFNMKKDKPLDVMYKLLQARDQLIMLNSAQLVNSLILHNDSDKKLAMDMKNKPRDLVKVLDATRMKQLIADEEKMLKSIAFTGTKVITDSMSKPECRMAALLVNGLKQFSAEILGKKGLFAEKLRKEYHAQYLDKGKAASLKKKPLVVKRPVPKISSAMNSEIMTLASQLEVKLQKVNPKANKSPIIMNAKNEAQVVMKDTSLDEKKRYDALRPVWDGLCRLDTLVKRIEEAQALIAEIENTFYANGRVSVGDKTKLKDLSNQLSNMVMTGADVKTTPFDLDPVNSVIAQAEAVKSSLAVKNPSLKSAQEQAVDVLITALDTDLKTLNALVEECKDQGVSVAIPAGVTPLKNLQTQFNNIKSNSTTSVTTKQNTLSNLKSKLSSLEKCFKQPLLTKYVDSTQDLIKKLNSVDIGKKHEVEVKGLENRLQNSLQNVDLNEVKQVKADLEQLLATVELKAKSSSSSSSASSSSSTSSSGSSTKSSFSGSSSSTSSSSTFSESSSASSSSLKSSSESVTPQPHVPSTLLSKPSPAQSSNNSNSSSTSISTTSSTTNPSSTSSNSDTATSGNKNSWVKWVIWSSIAVATLIVIILIIAFLSKRNQEKALEEQEADEYLVSGRQRIMA